MFSRRRRALREKKNVMRTRELSVGLLLSHPSDLATALRIILYDTRIVAVHRLHTSALTDPVSRINFLLMRRFHIVIFSHAVSVSVYRFAECVCATIFNASASKRARARAMVVCHFITHFARTPLINRSKRMQTWYLRYRARLPMQHITARRMKKKKGVIQKNTSGSIAVNLNPCALQIIIVEITSVRR